MARLADEACVDAHDATITLRANIRKDLATVETQEDRFLDLVGDPEWPQAKIKARLQAVRERKQRLAHQLETTTDALESGRAVLVTNLNLLDNPLAPYDSATTDARKTLNRAFFTRLYLDSIDRQPTATREALAEPVASLGARQQGHKRVWRTNRTSRPATRPLSS